MARSNEDQFERQEEGIVAFIRAAWSVAWLEYKGLKIYSINLWLAAVQEFTVVGVWYFVARFLSPMADAHVTQFGGHYVTYVLVGVLVNQVGLTALQSPFKTIAEAFWDKRLETYRLAIHGIWANIVGRLAWQVAFSTLWQVLAALLLVVTGVLALGRGIFWPDALLLWGLLILANVGIGLIGASLFFLLEVKSGQDPVTWIYQYLIQIVTGLYVPIAVLPKWLAGIGSVLPQTYTFNAMRSTILNGSGFSSITPDLLGLGTGTVIVVGLGLVMMRWALARAERQSGLGVVV